MSSSLASTSTHTIHNNTNPNNLPSSGHFSRPSIEAMNGFSNSHPDHEQAQKTTQQQQHHESNKRLLPVVDGETNPHNDFLTTDQQHEPQHNQYEDALESGNNNSNDTSASSGLSPKPSFWQRWQGLREISGFVVNHPHTQLFVVLLIACNALMMGLATFDFVKESESIQNAFATTDTVFLVLFTIELVLQFVYHGWRLLKDAWLVFDLVIVVTSWVLDEWQIIRALRIFRALRLITRIKVMQNLVVGTCFTIFLFFCFRLCCWCFYLFPCDSFILYSPMENLFTRLSLNHFVSQHCLASCLVCLPSGYFCPLCRISSPSCSHNCLRIFTSKEQREISTILGEWIKPSLLSFRS